MNVVTKTTAPAHQRGCIAVTACGIVLGGFVKPCVHPLPDVTLGDLNRQAHRLGYCLEILRFEFFLESVPECLQQQRFLGMANCDLRGRGGDFLDDAQHVLLEHFADGHRGLVILVTADARDVGIIIFSCSKRR